MSFNGGISKEHLKQFIERIERLNEEKKYITQDIKEVFSEARGSGFDVKTMKEIIKLRKMERYELEESEHLLDTYKMAMEMLPPLFDEEVNPAIKENTDNIEILPDGHKVTISCGDQKVKTDTKTIKKLADSIAAEGKRKKRAA